MPREQLAPVVGPLLVHVPATALAGDRRREENRRSERDEPVDQRRGRFRQEMLGDLERDREVEAADLRHTSLEVRRDELAGVDLELVPLDVVPVDPDDTLDAVLLEDG